VRYEDDMTERGVLVLSGPPCSGKTSVGRILATDSSSARPRRVHIEVDELFALLLPDSDRNRGDRMLAYDAAHALARLLLERGLTVVLECTYARREQRASLVAALADLPDVPLRVVELFVSPDEAAHRFGHRQQATDLDDGLVRERAAAFPYSDHAFRLASAAGSPEALARELTAWLGQQPPAVDRARWAESGRDWS
jgi:predicted kinase